jgi:hypothetical protein
VVFPCIEAEQQRTEPSLHVLAGQKVQGVKDYFQLGIRLLGPGVQYCMFCQ